MTNYTVELSIKGATEVRLYSVDDEVQEALDDIGGVEEVDLDFLEDNDLYNEYGTIVMDDCTLDDSETFSLEVKDEDDNVIYETTDPGSIVRYPEYEYDEEKEEDVWLPTPSFEFKGVEPGTYLVENNDLKWCTLTGEFEADEFDPKKLSFHPSEIFDKILCDEDVFLSELRYDNQKLDIEVDYIDPYGSDFHLLEAEELHECDGYGKCNFDGYRRD